MSDRGGSITGRLASGLGQGRQFTRLAWARAAFIARVGIDPFPGTLNLVVEDDRDLAAWRALSATPGLRVDPPDPGGCGARLYRVAVAGRVPGAIVVPEVPGYPATQIEVIAAVGLRAALGLADGEPVTLAVAPAEEGT